MSEAAGTDFLQLHAADAPARGLSGWLADRVRTAIAAGRLAPGAGLPASRTLAADLGVSRGVVVEAYRRLTDEGLLATRTGAGTVVAARPVERPAPRDSGGWRPPPERAVSPPLPEGAPTFDRAATVGPLGPTAGGAAATPWSIPGPDRTARPAPALRAPLLPAPGAPVDIDLSPGVPDLSAFPRSAWLRAERRVLGEAGTADLGYGDPRGHLALRTALTGWLARTRGVRADPADILVVSGVAQALALLAFVLHARGTREIAVEDPGSAGARGELEHWGLTPRPVPVDEQGLDVAALAASGLPVAVLTPAHQFPTGVVLGPQRRRELVQWSRGGGLVIEDDYDAEHRYDRPPVPAVQASAPDAVVHTGSTSKTLAPGLRLGWLVAPPWLRADLVAAKHASDIASPALAQLVLASLITGGDLDRHLRRVRARQRVRRDALLAGLRTHLPRATVHGVAAGLHLLVTLPAGWALAENEPLDVTLARRALAAGVLVHPLSWHRMRPGPPGLVLGYAAHPPDRLAEAARRIGQILQR